jgi:hypothetical protein
MLTSTAPVGQNHWGDSAANNSSPAAHSAEAQLKVSTSQFHLKQFGCLHLINQTSFVCFHPFSLPLYVSQ